MPWSGFFYFLKNVNYSDYETYIGFDAVASSKEDAFKMYLDKLKKIYKSEYDEIDKDINNYDIEEYNLTKKVCLPIFNNG
ncbi:hypothetical protein [Lactobacillus hominis]|uniref:Uncharacterized protein n=1 Tax=Lactobacillus hominis DSM 23910 = CRBIP 24.179 TaxID=1423758 RepID=I7L613_9LACO|nr:hypothetical protein [Lactobacillus hominis]KRM85727.1 hypothetical protein FC41_GL001041 [Lactobacillus hominis DSM 23910 = CRBIP 24.179]MCT3347226.1 hypothetical protein [Lactobacillus hominis]CCI81752.1 Protein of unknown function [Lactobacillus hominis DSM 23910 = CRBIP 24.179]